LRPRPVGIPPLRCDAETITDRDGRFRLAAPEGLVFRPAGDDFSNAFPLLRTTAPGFEVDVHNVQPVPKGDASVGDVVLETGASVRGRIVERGGRPVADAFISPGRNKSTSLDQVWDEAESAISGADGSFVLAGVSADVLTLLVEAAGRPLLEHAVSLAPG